MEETVRRYHPNCGVLRQNVDSKRRDRLDSPSEFVTNSIWIMTQDLRMRSEEGCQQKEGLVGKFIGSPLQKFDGILLISCCCVDWDVYNWGLNNDDCIFH